VSRSGDPPGPRDRSTPCGDVSARGASATGPPTAAEFRLRILLSRPRLSNAPSVSNPRAAGFPRGSPEPSLGEQETVRDDVSRDSIHRCPQAAVDFLHRIGVVRSGLRTVTWIDRSRSCPQECAQPGEISCPPSHPRSPHPGRCLLRSRAPAGRRPRHEHRAELGGCPPPTHPGCRCTAAARPCAGSGSADVPRRVVGGRGATEGEAGDGGRDRCTAVELSTCRHRKEAERPQPANRVNCAPTCAKSLDPQLPHV
jgi:hypothetical protein